MQKVGLIGVGAMGSAVLERQRQYERAVVVYEIAAAGHDHGRRAVASWAVPPQSDKGH